MSESRGAKLLLSLDLLAERLCLPESSKIVAAEIETNLLEPTLSLTVKGPSYPYVGHGMALLRIPIGEDRP